MLKRYVVPKFKQGDYGDGLTVAVKQIGARMRDDGAALWEKRQATFSMYVSSGFQPAVAEPPP